VDETSTEVVEVEVTVGPVVVEVEVTVGPVSVEVEVTVDPVSVEVEVTVEIGREIVIVTYPATASIAITMITTAIRLVREIAFLEEKSIRIFESEIDLAFYFNVYSSILTCMLSPRHPF
jgi:hypothetical protein